MAELDITYEQLAQAVSQVMTERGEYAGCPTPIMGQRLIIEPTYPHQIQAKRDDSPTGEVQEQRVVNHWVCASGQRRNVHKEVYVIHYKDENGNTKARSESYYKSGTMSRFTVVMNTIGCSTVWSLDAEVKAMEMLVELIGFHRYKQYLMTGCFIETSKRSGLKYIFRRNRPTIVVGEGKDGCAVVLTALCLHPIAYYDQTYAGCMVPTDDVLSHLLLMRGDEHMFWKRANHHRAEDWTSGI